MGDTESTGQSRQAPSARGDEAPLRTDRAAALTAVWSLRGFAVACVAVNHYLNTYVGDDYAGFANAIIAVFFVLSGYAIYGSLHRRLGAPGSTTRAVLGFYRDRALRIYPLYLAALVLHSYVYGQPCGVSAYLGWRSPVHFWFVNAILHCYLVSPILYWWLVHPRCRSCASGAMATFAGAARGGGHVFAKEDMPTPGDECGHGTRISGAGDTQGWRVPAAIVGGVVLVNIPVVLASRGMISLPESLTREPFAYRGLFLSHVVLFVLGMAMGRRAAATRSRRRGCSVLVALAPWIVMAAALTVWKVSGNKGVRLACNVVFLALCVPACGLAIRRRLAIPGLRWLGRYSYSVFLFHLAFYGLLAQWGLLEKNSLWGALLTLALLPVFLGACWALELLTLALLPVFLRACWALVKMAGGKLQIRISKP